MRFDLHIHSCLSGCAALTLSPRAIAARARECGLDVIGLTDHNSALNAPAMLEAARQAPLSAVIGIEVTSREEAHLLCLFEHPDAALRFGRELYTRLPHQLNRPLRFGDQAVVNARDEVLELVPRMLLNAVDLSIEEIAHRFRELDPDGLLIAAHIDRPLYSVTSQLGFVPTLMDWDAVEVSAACTDAQAAQLAAGSPWIRASDAHALEHIGRAWNEVELPRFSLPALRRALRAGHVTPIRAV